MRIHKLVLLSLSTILFASCGRDGGMRITTNTFANKEVIPYGFKPGDSFSISTKQKGDQLFAKEVSQKIASILTNKGFKLKSPHAADYNLRFSFGMKKSTHVRDVPVFIPDYGHWHYHHYYHPYGFGYRVAYVPEEYTLFNKILLIEVNKNRRFLTTKSTPVWQGTAHSYEEDSDLRDAIDYLLITVFRYFGVNTKKYMKSIMDEGDKEVERLRQEYFKPVTTF